MKRAVPIVLVLLLVLVLGYWLKRRHPSGQSAGSDAESSSVAADVSVIAMATASATNGLLGETILRGYGDTNFPPENDLTLLSRLMDNSLLLLKSAANRPLSANEDWADLFRGRNAAGEKFLPAGHVAVNASGQLVDRWGTPLFFHALGGGRYELRSAGPDRKLWTDDDLHRNADGSFRRGNALNPPSLLESATRARLRATAP